LLPFADGRTADIDQDFNIILLEEGKKIFNASVAVTDAINGGVVEELPNTVILSKAKNLIPLLENLLGAYPERDSSVA
jgi:hypothetical protein